MTKDIYTYTVDFPVTCATEMVRLNPDGSYTILLNAKMDYEKRVDSYLHALGHIMNNDFEKDDVQEIESCAHGRRLVV